MDDVVMNGQRAETGDHHGKVMDLRIYRDLREEQEEARSWPTRFRGWARTLRGEEQMAMARPDDYCVAYIEMAGAMAEALEGWAAEMERDR